MSASLAVATAAPVAFGQATSGLVIAVYGQSTNGVTSYAASALPAIFPGQSGINFTNGTFRSQNGNATAVFSLPGSWGASWNELPTYASLLAELTPAFELTLDAGLSTERKFTTTLNTGALPATATLPAFSNVQPNDTVSGTRPTFQFDAPDNGYQFSFYRYDGMMATLVDSRTVSAGQGAFTPSVDMIDGDRYVMVLEREISPSGFGFSAPVDQNDQGLAGYFTDGRFITRASVTFTASVPEPGLVGLCGMVVAAGLCRVRRSA